MWCGTLNRGRGQNGCFHEIRSLHLKVMLFSHLWSNTPYSIVRLLLTFIANCHCQLSLPNHGFLQFLPNLSILEYVLLHITNINVAIAHILISRIGSTTIRDKVTKINVVRNPQKWAWSKMGVTRRYKNGMKSNFVFHGLKYPVVRLLLSFNKKCQRNYASYWTSIFPVEAFKNSLGIRSFATAFPFFSI
jgi:hypothetical protein